MRTLEEYDSNMQGGGGVRSLATEILAFRRSGEARLGGYRVDCDREIESRYFRGKKHLVGAGDGKVLRTNHDVAEHCFEATKSRMLIDLQPKIKCKSDKW